MVTGRARSQLRPEFRISSRKKLIHLAEPRGEWMEIDVRRRKFIAVLSGALVGRAIPAYAQHAARTYTVGVLMGLANDVETQARITAFERGLEAGGWSVARAYGSNIALQVATPTPCGHSPKSSPSLSPTAFLATAPRS